MMNNPFMPEDDIQEINVVQSINDTFQDVHEMGRFDDDNEIVEREHRVTNIQNYLEDDEFAQNEIECNRFIKEQSQTQDKEESANDTEDDQKDDFNKNIVDENVLHQTET